MRPFALEAACPRLTITAEEWAGAVIPGSLSVNACHVVVANLDQFLDLSNEASGFDRMNRPLAPEE
jgi:hypothetical protein